MGEASYIVLMIYFVLEIRDFLKFQIPQKEATTTPREGFKIQRDKSRGRAYK